MKVFIFLFVSFTLTYANAFVLAGVEEGTYRGQIKEHDQGRLNGRSCVIQIEYRTIVVEGKKKRYLQVYHEPTAAHPSGLSFSKPAHEAYQDSRNLEIIFRKKTGEYLQGLFLVIDGEMKEVRPPVSFLVLIGRYLDDGGHEEVRGSRYKCVISEW